MKTKTPTFETATAGKTFYRVLSTADGIRSGLNSSYSIPTLFRATTEDIQNAIDSTKEFIEIRKNQIEELEQQLLFLELSLESGGLQAYLEYETYMRSTN